MDLRLVEVRIGRDEVIAFWLNSGFRAVSVLSGALAPAEMRFPVETFSSSSSEEWEASSDTATLPMGTSYTTA